MPYIDKTRRNVLMREKVAFVGGLAGGAGELTYLFTEIMMQYLAPKAQRYQHYATVLGALEGAKLELARRYLGPYEETKLKENGDV